MPVDPCAEAARLRELRTAIVSGKSESRVRFDTEEVEYHKADLPALDREIARFDRDCAIAEGRTASRTRFAKGFRFR